jgi:hypothetical protein
VRDERGVALRVARTFEELGIDHSYLRQWATTLGVADLLDRALAHSAR